MAHLRGIRQNSDFIGGALALQYHMLSALARLPEPRRCCAMPLALQRKFPCTNSTSPTLFGDVFPLSSRFLMFSSIIFVPSRFWVYKHHVSTSRRQKIPPRASPSSFAACYAYSDCYLLASASSPPSSTPHSISFAFEYSSIAALRDCFGGYLGVVLTCL